MPFTPNRQFKAAPRLLAGAKGMFYYAEDGRELLDGTAGLWCVNLGHGRQEIADAVQRQLMILDYAPSFNLGHPLAFDFATRLAGIAPQGLDRVFFTNSGSESVDTALKIAIAYHRARGQGQRTRLVGRERGYHGVGFGGISVGGLVNNRKTFPLLPADHLPHTHDMARNAFSRGQPIHGSELADHLEKIVALQGAETLAAVIVEPVAGSAGVLPPPAGYLPRLRQLCDKHGVLLIFDEVITGYGRLGAPFAAQYFGVTPDLMTTAKGLTNGVLPMGAVFARREVHDALMVGPEGLMELFHGYTYSGHPVACAAGMAVMDIYEREGLFTRVASIAQAWEDAIHGLRDCPHVIDIRNMGLTAAIELEPRPGKAGERGHEALNGAFAAGLVIRTTGDIIALSPPLIAEQAHFDRLAETLRGVLKAIA
ncbi:MAG TPA: aspartate aminotransferase family protein [Caulobacteraceae bacterium]|nr:aspartate aminotransferase family protein [Caulobacteraceae bacterium]